MSDQSELLDKKRREIVEFLSGVKLKEGTEFRTLDDGGMGSFAVSDCNPCGSLKLIKEAKYKDEDGVDAYISMMGDDQLNFIEVTFWKVDFSKLVEFPTSNKVMLLD